MVLGVSSRFSSVCAMMTCRFVSFRRQQAAACRVQKGVSARLKSLLTIVAGLAISLPAIASQVDNKAERDALLERVVIDDTLEATVVRVMSMSESEFVGRTSEGKMLRMPTDKVLAIVPTSFQHEPVRRAPTLPRNMRSAAEQVVRHDGLLLLTDGQTLAGAPVRDFSTLESLQEAMPWQSQTLDRIVMPLEQISAVLLRGREIEWPAVASNDVVVLKNNDIAQGFVDTKFESGETDLSILVEGENGKVRRILQRRVASIFLSNPAHHEGGAWVWLADGSALRTTGVQFGPDMQAVVKSVFTTPMLLGKEVDDKNEETKALNFNSGIVLAYTPHHEALAALAKVPWNVQATDSGRRWTTPPVIGDSVLSPLGAADIELPGPMSVTWTLPALSTRIAGVLELPESSRVWGDCNVTISTGDGAKLFSTRLNGEKPTAAFNVVLPKGKQSLTVRVDAGENGPIEDRVLIRRALILLDVKDPASAPSTKPGPAPRG